MPARKFYSFRCSVNTNQMTTSCTVLSSSQSNASTVCCWGKGFQHFCKHDRPTDCMFVRRERPPSPSFSQPHCQCFPGGGGQLTDPIDPQPLDSRQEWEEMHNYKGAGCYHPESDPLATPGEILHKNSWYKVHLSRRKTITASSPIQILPLLSNNTIFFILKAFFQLNDD